MGYAAQFSRRTKGVWCFSHWHRFRPSDSRRELAWSRGFQQSQEKAAWLSPTLQLFRNLPALLRLPEDLCTPRLLSGSQAECFVQRKPWIQKPLGWGQHSFKAPGGEPGHLN